MARRAEKVDKELFHILHSKMIDGGWNTVRSFTAGSKVPCSVETVRRAMNECDYKGIAPHTLAIIAHYLGFTPDEIKALLRDHTGDEDLWKLIGDHSCSLTPDEEAMVEIFRQIKASGKETLTQFVSSLSLIASAFKLQIDGELAKIRR